MHNILRTETREITKFLDESRKKLMTTPVTI